MAPRPRGALRAPLAAALLLLPCLVGGAADTALAACSADSEALDAGGDHVSLLQVGTPSWRKRSKRRRHNDTDTQPYMGDPFSDMGSIDGMFGSGRNAFMGDERALQRSGYCDLRPRPHGFVQMWSDVQKGMLLLELTDALARRGGLRVMVTAMSVAGSYMDDAGGFQMQLASPLEEMQSVVFDFRLSPDRTYVDLYKPEMSIRTTDDQSREALETGTGSGWVGRLSVLDMPTCPGSRPTPLSGPVGPPLQSRDRIVVDGDELIAKGFLVAPLLASMASSNRLVRARGYPQNLDVTVEYMTEEEIGYVSTSKVGFSMIELPETPMAPRVSDDRLLYFTTEYKDLGVHPQLPNRLPSDILDGDVAMIWRYDLASLPGRQIRIHVDPTVPARWRRWFREGVEAWNDAFAEAGHPRAIRAVLPDDPDWPRDYDMGDARFSTISWSLSNQVLSMGMAKVDPRSGQIMKSDILMSDGWVHAWLRDLDHLAPNITHWAEQSRGRTLAKHRRQRVGDEESEGDRGRDRKRRGREQRAALDSERGMVSLLAAGAGKPLSQEQQEDLLGAGLRSIVMHETGHILGLRHNFKGSLGVSYECTQNMSCSAVNGLTASVMDYLPMNMPSEDKDVHVFSPVVGAYDKLAIRYGYTDTSERPGPLRQGSHPDLQEILEAAEAYETCYDDDEMMEDPTCVPYDLSADPLEYYEGQLARIAEAHRHLVNMTIMPGASYMDYGSAVDDMLLMIEDTGLNAVLWLGGVSTSYAHRRANGGAPRRAPRRSLPAASQRRALAILLRAVRPDKHGLLPPPESLPYLVTSEGVSDGMGHVASLQLEQRARRLSRMLLGEALSAWRMQQVYEQERLALAERASPRGGAAEEHFGVAELLAQLVGAVLADGFGEGPHTSLAWDTQLELVRSLKALYDEQVNLPAEVSSQVLFHLGQVREAVRAEFESADKEAGAPGWRPCGREGQRCACAGLVRYGTPEEWSAALTVSQEVNCTNAVFGDPVRKVRKHCECLPTRPRQGDLLKSHLLLLRRELSSVFCPSGDAAMSDPHCVDELRALQ